MTYSLLKLLHLLAVVVFLGNISTGLFWMSIAVKTQDLKIISHSIKAVIRSDQLFTVPGVLFIVIGGFMAAILGRLPLLDTGWIFWSIVLFSFSGLAFAWKVVPLQKKIAQLVNTDKASTNMDWAHFNKVYFEWKLWGFIALVTPLCAMIMMTLKIPQQSIF